MTDAIDTWMVAAGAGDAEGTRAALAPDVTLVSPVTDQFTFRGADEVVDLLRDVFEVIDDIRFVRVLRTASGAVLEVEAMVGGVALHEVQLIDLDDTGGIAQLTLFFRPLVASTRFLRELGPRVARRRGNPTAARTLAVAGAFLDMVAGSGDRTFLPMAAPPSAALN